MYARIGIECLAGRFGILPIIVIKSVLNNGRYTPNFTIIMHETNNWDRSRSEEGMLFRELAHSSLTI